MFSFTLLSDFAWVRIDEWRGLSTANGGRRLGHGERTVHDATEARAPGRDEAGAGTGAWAWRRQQWPSEREKGREVEGDGEHGRGGESSVVAGFIEGETERKSWGGRGRGRQPFMAAVVTSIDGERGSGGEEEGGARPFLSWGSEGLDAARPGADVERARALARGRLEEGDGRGGTRPS